MRKSLFLALTLALALLAGGRCAMAEDWYQSMLRDGQLALGNNWRLKQVIARAEAGETITIATIGGSITEGAGASRYAECYAKRLQAGFEAAYGSARLVNAGAAGTPSPFGLLRYQRDVAAQGNPDILIIEYAVNDGGEPTNHRAYESMVVQALSQPNQPVVILLFSVFDGGYTLQDALRPIGERYDLMMVSIRDAAYAHIGQEWTTEEFFSDAWHPTSLGHQVMADCLLSAIAAANAQETASADIDLTVPPVYGTDFVGLQTIFAENVPDGFDRGGFTHDDRGTYGNIPLGRVCGANFFHTENDDNTPLTFTATFKNLLIAYRGTNSALYGRAEVRIDGKVARILGGADSDWGQSLTALVFEAKEAAEHTVEIRMKQADRRFTITAIGFTP